MVMLNKQDISRNAYQLFDGQAKLGTIALACQLLSAYWYEGKGYEFNFSKLWNFTRTKFNCVETNKEIIWHIEQKTWRNAMVTDITCQRRICY